MKRFLKNRWIAPLLLILAGGCGDHRTDAEVLAGFPVFQMIEPAETLAEMKAAGHLPVSDLQGALTKGHLLERRKAIAKLSKTIPSTPGEFDFLVSSSKNKSRNKLRRAALKALRNVPADARKLRKRYRSLLAEDSELLQHAGIVGCARLGVRRALPRIRELYAGKPVRKFAELNSDEEVVWDMVYLHSAAAARVALGEPGEKVISELLSRDDLVNFGPVAGPLLASYGAVVLPKAVELAADGNPLQIDAGRIAIASMRDEAAVPGLVALVDHEDAGVSIAAGNALSFMPIRDPANKRLIERTFRPRLDSEDKRVRRQAKEILGVKDKEK